MDSAPTVGGTDRAHGRGDPGVTDCHQVRCARPAEPLCDIHVLLDGSLSLKAAHELTEQIEQAAHQVNPDLDVTVHAERRHSTDHYERFTP